MPRILLVDDDIAEISAVKRVLTRAGHQTVLATNASDALVAIAHERPHLLVISSTCENGETLDLARRLPDDPATAGLPLIVLGDADGLPPGARCLSRPVDPELLGSEVKGAMGAANAIELPPSPSAAPAPARSAPAAPRPGGAGVPARTLPRPGATVSPQGNRQTLRPAQPGPLSGGRPAPTSAPIALGAPEASDDATASRRAAADALRARAEELRRSGQRTTASVPVASAPAAPSPAARKPAPVPPRSLAEAIGLEDDEDRRFEAALRGAGLETQEESRGLDERSAADEARQRAADEARQRAADEALRALEEEASSHAAEREALEAARREMQEQARQDAAEAARLAEAEERGRQEAVAAAQREAKELSRREAEAAERARSEAEARRVAEEEVQALRRQLEEERRRAEERVATAMRRAAAEEEAAGELRRMAEEEVRRREEDAKLREQEARLREEDARLREEEARRREEEVARNRAEEEERLRSAIASARSEMEALRKQTEEETRRRAEAESALQRLGSARRVRGETPTPATQDAATFTPPPFFAPFDGAEDSEPPPPDPAEESARRRVAALRSPPAAGADPAPFEDPAPATYASEPIPPQDPEEPVRALPRPAPQLRSGDTADLPAPRLLAMAARARLRGRMDFQGEVARSIWFEDGRVVGVSSADPSERVEEVALRLGLITRDQHRQIAHAAVTLPSRRAALLLLERGFLKATELTGLVRRRTEEVVFGVFADVEARFRWMGTEVPPEERTSLERGTAALAVEGVRRRWLAPRVDALLGGPATLLAPIPGAPAVAELGLSADERRTVALADGLRALEEIVQASPLDAFSTRQVLAALVLVGALSIRALQAGRPAGHAATAIDLARVKDKLEQARRADYFTVLGVGRLCTPHEVREAADRLQAEFEPRRFAGQPDEGLPSRLGEILQVIQDAREVLADDRLREEYLRGLGDAG